MKPIPPMAYATTEQIGEALGERLASIRLARNKKQDELAEEAGISVRTLRRLESGQGGTLDNFIRVLKALGIQQNLEGLLPDPSVRPIERIETSRGTERQRARPKKEPDTGETKAGWKWGDEVDE